MNKEQQLIDYLENKRYTYVLIKDENSLNKIFNLYIDNIIFDPINDIEFLYIGSYYNINKDYPKAIKYYLQSIKLENIHAMITLAYYYEDIEKNYDLMKKYYLIAINLNNDCAMINLADYYKNIEKNSELMKKYYLMAINLSNDTAMINLADYYRDIEKNYDLMEKYYLMASELGNSTAMNNFGYYHHFITHNNSLMKKYYLIAIESGNVSSMYNLGHYYHYVEINYDLMKKYYLMAINLGNKHAMTNFVNYYNKNNQIIKTFKLCVKYINLIDREILIDILVKISSRQMTDKYENLFLEFISTFEFEPEDNIPTCLKLLSQVTKNQISIMDLHFKYSVNGLGFHEAKQDFIERCVN
jgi:TPR repeat protein